MREASNQADHDTEDFQLVLDRNHDRAGRMTDEVVIDEKGLGPGSLDHVGAAGADKNADKRALEKPSRRRSRCSGSLFGVAITESIVSV